MNDSRSPLRQVTETLGVIFGAIALACVYGFVVDPWLTELSAGQMLTVATMAAGAALMGLLPVAVLALIALAVLKYLRAK